MKNSSEDQKKRSDFHEVGVDLMLQKSEPLFCSKFPALSNIAIASLVSIAAKDHVPHAYLFVWVSLMSAVSLYRISLVERFRRAQVTSAEAPLWESRMFLCAAV